MFQQQTQDNFESRNNFLRSARKGNKTGFELADGCIAIPNNNQQVKSLSLSSSSETSSLCDAIVFKNHHNLFRYLNATCGNNKRNKNNNKFTSFINFPREATREFIKCYQDESISGWHVNRVFHLLESFIGVVFSIPAVMRVIKPHEHGLFEHLIFIMPGKLLVDCKINLNKGSRFKIEGFFTMNELCKYYNEPLNGTFKKLLSGLFDNMQAIEDCFERDSFNLDVFWCQTKIRPFRLNIKLSQGLRNGIYHYFSCDGNCNSIACSKSANKLKRDVFFAVGSNARAVCDEIEETLSTKIVEAKYQIFVSKGKLQAEIVLFCNLAGDIVGFPITWQHNEQKWIVVSMLVSQMKQNTMLPSLFVGHMSGLKNLCGNLLDLNNFVNLYGDCDAPSCDSKNNSGSGRVNLFKSEELKCKDVEKEPAQAQQQYAESQHQVRLLQAQSQCNNYYNYNNYNYNSNNYTNDNTYSSMPLTNSNMFNNTNNYWNVQNMGYSVGFRDESTGASNNRFNFNQTPPPVTKTHSNTSLSSNNSNGNSVISSIISSTSTGSYSNISNMTGISSSTASVNSGVMMNNGGSTISPCPQYTQVQNVNVSLFPSMNNCSVNMNTSCDIRDMIQSGIQLRVALLNQLSQSTNNNSNSNNNNNNNNNNGNVSKLLVDQTNYFKKQLS